MTRKFLQGGFTKDDFLEFVDMRSGNVGDVVYWYAYGDMTSFPDGKRLAVVEGVDTGRLVSLDVDKLQAQVMGRKYVVFRDPDSGEPLTTPEGKPVILGNFTYQILTFWLENDRLIFKGASGSGQNYRENTGGPHSEKQVLGPATVYTTPFWINYPMQIWECYDFMRIKENGKVYDKGLWSASYPLPPFMGEGRCTWHSYFHRYNSFEALPESFQQFTLEHAPLWKQPPADWAEVERLKKGV